MKKTSWTAKIDPSASKKYAADLERLKKHVEQMTKTPVQRIPDSALGKKAAGWFETEKFNRLAMATLAGIDGCRQAKDQKTEAILLDVLAWLVRRNLDFTQADFEPLLAAAAEAPSLEQRLAVLPGVVANIRRIAGASSLPPKVVDSLKKIRKSLLEGDAKKPKAAVTLAETIKSLVDDSVVERLHPDDGWADWLRSWYAKLKPAEQEAWNPFLRDVGGVYPETTWSVSYEDTGMRDSLDVELIRETQQRMQLPLQAAAKWKQTMAGHVQRLGRDEVVGFLQRCLHNVPGSKPGMLAREGLNRAILRGLLWLSVELATPELIQAVQRATRYFYEKKSGLADMGVMVLFQIASPVSAGALSALGHFLRWESQRNFIAVALSMLAEKDVHGDELAGEALPSFGLTELGKLTRSFGDVHVDLEVKSGRAVELTWKRGDKELKSIPAAIRRDHGEEIETFKTTAKGVKEALTGLVTRLEGSWLTKGRFQVENWRKQLIDHFVGGTLGRRLIWRFDANQQVKTAMWGKHGLNDAHGKSVKIANDAMVSLWHPLDAPVEEVIAWRERLEKDGITQPFKQAHREVYVLTDAERQTGTYSNRFAAHILRQAQFRQLAKSRTWNAPLIGPWDSGERGPERKLSHWGLRAEFWVQGVDNDYQTGYTYVATDQVRFHHNEPGNAALVPLTDIPRLPFSEVMRDVDLFVGVASVGNDPEWSDGGPGGRFRDYWEGYSFGALSATAKTRRDLLERLIPRLKIADRCSLQDRFLKVRGELRTYKIHLGSGNILMSPNDQYLCIVAKRSSAGAGRVFLPFEGDGTLSVILSKAFLLADDTKITDPTIVSQLKK